MNACIEPVKQSLARYALAPDRGSIQLGAKQRNVLGPFWGLNGHLASLSAGRDHCPDYRSSQAAAQTHTPRAVCPSWGHARLYPHAKKNRSPASLCQRRLRTQPQLARRIALRYNLPTTLGHGLQTPDLADDHNGYLCVRCPVDGDPDEQIDYQVLPGIRRA